MADSKISVTEGSGKNLHTWDRTVSAVLVQDQVTVAGLPFAATYRCVATGVPVATTAAHCLQLMAGSSNNVYVRRIIIQQRTLTTAATLDLQMLRLSTAGTGGTAITAMPHDTADAAAGAAGMYNPTAKGTETGTTILEAINVPIVAAHPITARIVWTADLGEHKAIKIPAGTSNGLCLKVATGIATATIDWMIEFTELSY